MVTLLFKCASILFIFILILAAACLPSQAFTQHGPAGATIHPRGDSIAVEYYANGLDLTLASDWAEYEKSTSGQYAQPGSAIVGAYLAKSIQITCGGRPLTGRLIFQRQLNPTTPDASTFRAIMQYRDPTGASLAGPLTVTSKLFAFDKNTIVRYSLGSDSIDAHVGVPITFPASAVSLSVPNVFGDYFGLGFWAGLDGITLVLVLLLLSPLSGIKPMCMVWLRFAVGVAIASVVVGGFHALLNEFTGRWAIAVVAVVVALINLAGNRIGRRDIVEFVAGLLAGAAMTFPLAEIGLPSRLSAVAVVSNTIGALVGIAICGVGVAIFVLLTDREAQKRSRTDPKAVANLRLIITIASLLAVVFLGFRL